MDNEFGEKIAGVLGANGSTSLYSNSGTDLDGTVLGLMKQMKNTADINSSYLQQICGSIQSLAIAVEAVTPAVDSSNQSKLNALERATAQVAANEVERLERELEIERRHTALIAAKIIEAKQALTEAVMAPGTAVPRSTIQGILRALERTNEEEARQVAEAG